MPRELGAAAAGWWRLSGEGAGQLGRLVCHAQSCCAAAVISDTAPCTVPRPAPTLSSFPAARQVVVVDHSAHGVDLPEDVASIEDILRRQRLQ